MVTRKLLLPIGLQQCPFASLQDRSSREELLVTVRRSVMLGAAEVTGCDKVLVGDTGTRLAVELMASVASGVGGGLPHR